MYVFNEYTFYNLVRKEGSGYNKRILI